MSIDADAYEIQYDPYIDQPVVDYVEQVLETEEHRLQREISKELVRERARREARRLANEKEKAADAALSVDFDSCVVNGFEFVFGQDAEIDAVWGTSDRTLWAAGEGLMIAARQGLGKTTLAMQLAKARLGLMDDVLGFPVKPGDGKVLYLAMDRPRQAARAMRRLFVDCTEGEKEILREKLIVWRGPLPKSVVMVPQIIRDMARHFGADTVFIDSIKDAIPKLTDDEAGLAFNMAVQYCVREGIEICDLHHNRKPGSDANTKAVSVEDIYGSTWITAGHGSIIGLSGKTGDLAVTLTHLKLINDEIGPLEIVHDHDRGISTINGGFDMLVAVRRAKRGITVMEAASQMFGTQNVNTNQKAKARRQLDKLFEKGLVTKSEGTSGGVGGGEAARYYAVGQFEVPTGSNAPVIPHQVSESSMFGSFPFGGTFVGGSFLTGVSPF